MHEFALAEAMVTQIDEIMIKERADKLKSVTVIIGELSGVQRDAFEFAFPFAMESTKYPEAKLVVEEEDALISCQNCNKESHPDVPIIQCQECESINVKIIKGKEFIIKSLELE